ncbi:uncharacterized protein HMPREF1541_05105 [Cyphellophora europaea CBS 101466]|uniref:Transcription factor domain-containing protein n=1 Tax=Cyphellophora europaea (strain CBS 101466) TaxID=1220924 RepID=W2RWW7_CYPE1|nr:uncharacterized protein HMPREF1541_05105 [Cyphellophora europaea CBS 101466]ETN40825.1 hypothetical protein HMPREF1541_05105 [Cyphellophora europaea CBS 101466]
MHEKGSLLVKRPISSYGTTHYPQKNYTVVPGAHAASRLIQIVQTPLGSGYDPFGAFSIRIDSHVSELLKFWRYYLNRPSVQRDRAIQHLFNSAWQLAMRCLWTPCDGYSFLAAAADFYTASTQSNQMMVLAAQWRLQAIALLRAQIASRGLSPRDSGCIMRLLAGDLAVGNFAAALSHAKILSSIFNPQNPAYEAIPSAAKHAFLWQETHRATATLSRPLIELSHRTTDINFALLDSRLRIPEVEIDLEALDDVRLVSLYTQLRSYLDVLAQLSDRNIQLSRHASIELSSNLLVLGGKLLDHGILCTDNARHTDDALEMLRLSQFAAASLAALYWLRLMTRMETDGDDVNGPGIMVATWPQGPRIAERMRSLLETSESVVTLLLPPSSGVSVSERLRPELRLRVFLLEVGSFLEETAMRRAGDRCFYYQEQQQQLLLRTGLSEKPAAYEAILKGFIPTNTPRVYAPAWFTPSIRTWGLS